MYKVISCLLSLMLAMSTSVVLAQNMYRTDSSKTNTSAAQPLKVDLLPPMQEMIGRMKAVKPTSDPDIDFANQAKLHTQGTRDLLKVILSVQSDSALTQAANTMLSTAETDLTTLSTLSKTLKPTRRDAAFVKQQNRVIAAIREKINQSASAYKLTKNPEANIHLLLNDQRQDAINLATNYLLFGKNTELRNFAQQSVEKAKLDIDILKNLPNRSK